jgi:TolB-like protein/DNA-binding SARP family transcriptional activator
MPKRRSDDRVSPGDSGGRPGFSNPVLAVSLNGAVRASVDGCEVRLLSRHARAVLAILALADGHRATRERVWGLLWGDGSQFHAQVSLRQILGKLRRVLAAAGYAGHVFGPTWLDLGADTVRVDLHEAISAAEAHVVHPALRDMPLFADTLLADVEDLNGEVAAWVRDVRRMAMDRLAGALARGLEEPGPPAERRRDLAEALLRLDPCHEPACRALMRLRADAGDPTGAERAYLDLQAALAERFDTLPSDATRDAYAGVKLGDAPAPPAPRLPAEPRPPTGLIEGPLVAVLPFSSQVPGEMAPYLGAGLAEEMIAALAGFDELGVIARNSAMHYAGQYPDVRQVGRDLGVGYVVSGSLRRLGHEMRLSVELADAQTARVLWPGTFTFPDPALFDALDEAVLQVVAVVAPRIRAAELARIRLKRPENLGAYDHMLQGLDLLYRLEPERFEAAKAYLDQAMALDDGYAMPRALAAEWHSLRVGQAWSSDPAHDGREAVRMAEGALERDPGNVRALTELAHDRAFLHRDYDEALSLFSRAEGLGPGSAQVWAQSAPTYCYVGEGDEAVRRMRRAMLLSPQDLFAFRQSAIMALAHYTSGRFEESIAWGRKAQGQNGQYTAVPRFLAAAAVGAGDLAAARGHAERLMALEPDFTVAAYRNRCPFQDPARVEVLCGQLLAAGLPL